MKLQQGTISCDIFTVKCCFGVTTGMWSSPQPERCTSAFVTINRDKWRSAMLRIDNILRRGGKWMWLRAGYRWIQLCVVLSCPNSSIGAEVQCVVFCACMSKAALQCLNKEAVTHYYLLSMWSVSEIQLFKYRGKICCGALMSVLLGEKYV